MTQEEIDEIIEHVENNYGSSTTINHSKTSDGKDRFHVSTYKGSITTVLGRYFKDLGFYVTYDEILRNPGEGGDDEFYLTAKN